METLGLIQHYVERILYKKNIAIPNFLLGEKLHWNKSAIAKVCLVPYSTKNQTEIQAILSLAILVRNVLKEKKLWNRIFKSAVW